MVWCFDVSPSALRPIAWSNTRRDIEVRAKLKVGYAQTQALQQYQAIALVANQLFGSDKNNDPNRESSANENVFRPRTSAEMAQAFGIVFGG